MEENVIPGESIEGGRLFLERMLKDLGSNALALMQSYTDYSNAYELYSTLMPEDVLALSNERYERITAVCKNAMERCQSSIQETKKKLEEHKSYEGNV